MKLKLFKKQESSNSNKSLLNLLKDKSVNCLNLSQLNKIKGGIDDGDHMDEGMDFDHL